MNLAPHTVNVLVADDEEEILELLGEYLRTVGFKVRLASDGQDALDVVRSGWPDVVISDLKMPSLSGLDVLEEVERLPEPVAMIVMTGFGTVETAIQAMKNGAADYLLKPFKLRSVHTAVRSALTQVGRRREALRTREAEAFYEYAALVDSVSGLPRLFGMLASVARRENGVREVAVWTASASGWEAAARGGMARALSGFDPHEVTEGPYVGEGVLAVGIQVGSLRGGVLAIGGDVNPMASGPRIQAYSQALGQAMHRVGWVAPNR